MRDAGVVPADAAGLRCLSALIDHSPDAAFLETALRDDAPEWMRAAVERDRGGRSPAELAEWLAAEHTRLFDTPYASLPPLEGLRRGDAELVGPRARAVRAAYAAAGFEVDPAHGRLPDHLSVELAFLAILVDQGRHHDAEQFVRDHLAAWVPEWVEEVLELAPPAFYCAILIAIDEEFGRDDIAQTACPRVPGRLDS